MNNCIVIIGKGEISLALLQGFGRAKREIHYFIDRRGIPNNYSEYSRYGVKHQFYSIEQLVDELSELQDSYSSKLSVFIASSKLLTEIRLNHREVFDKFNVFSNPLEWVDRFSTKDKMYAYATTKGIATPQYKLLSEYKHGDLKFPLILKRNVEFDLSFKVKIVKTKIEFDEFVEHCPDDISLIIVQELVPDEGFRNLSFRAFFSRGQLLGGLAVEEIRCWPAGVSTYIEEIERCDSAILEETTKRLFNQTNYTGFVEIGYKYSLNTKTPYILDVNPRIPHTHDAFNRKFTNISEFYSNIDSNPIQLNPKPERISWINPVRDMKVRNKGVGFFTVLKQLTRSYWGGGIYDGSDWLMFVKYFSVSFVNHAIKVLHHK